MKKMAEFEINPSDDRASICSILAFAGYPVVVEDRTEKYKLSPKYIVVVYDKEAGES